MHTRCNAHTRCTRDADEMHMTCTRHAQARRCEEWAATGQCELNAQYMKEACRKACGLCASGAARSVAMQRSDAARANASAAAAACADANTNCAAWAFEGHCSSNAAYMRKSCQRACGACTSCADLLAGGAQSIILLLALTLFLCSARSTPVLMRFFPMGVYLIYSTDPLDCIRVVFSVFSQSIRECFFSQRRLRRVEG